MTSLLTEALKKEIKSEKKCINININNNINDNDSDNDSEYSNVKSSTLSPVNVIDKKMTMNENSFDPSKFSPPNDFMNKLQSRYHYLFQNNSHNLSQK